MLNEPDVKGDKQNSKANGYIAGNFQEFIANTSCGQDGEKILSSIYGNRAVYKKKAAGLVQGKQGSYDLYKLANI